MTLLGLSVVVLKQYGNKIESLSRNLYNINLTYNILLMLLQGGKVSFGYIYGIGGCGVVALYLLLNIMSDDGVGIGCVASVVGYCILPMVFLSSISVLMSLT